MRSEKKNPQSRFKCVHENVVNRKYIYEKLDL